MENKNRIERKIEVQTKGDKSYIRMLTEEIHSKIGLNKTIVNNCEVDITQIAKELKIKVYQSSIKGNHRLVVKENEIYVLETLSIAEQKVMIAKGISHLVFDDIKKGKCYIPNEDPLSENFNFNLYFAYSLLLPNALRIIIMDNNLTTKEKSERMNTTQIAVVQIKDFLINE